MRYKKEVKEQACQAAKDGMHLKLVQAQFGPNPKATMRYLAKQGIDYKELKKSLRPKTLIQLSKERQIYKTQKNRKRTPLKVPRKANTEECLL